MFLDVLMPTDVSYGFSGGPDYRTERVELPSGIVRRNVTRDQPIYRYSAPYSAMSESQYTVLRDLFHQTRGGAHSFRFRDWADYQASADVIATGDGSTAIYQTVKIYGSDNPLTRPITKPVSAQYFVDGVPDAGATVDPLTGIVTLSSILGAGEVLTWTGTFDVPVYYDTDTMTSEIHNRNQSMGYISQTELTLTEDRGA